MRFYPKSPVGAFADACIEVVGVREGLVHLPLVMRIARKSNIESILAERGEEVQRMLADDGGGLVHLESGSVEEWGK